MAKQHTYSVQGSHKGLNYRLWSFIFVALVGIILCLPSFTDINGRKIALGLDLQGGLNLLLGIKTQEAIKARFSSLASQIVFDTKKEKFDYPALKNFFGCCFEQYHLL